MTEAKNNAELLPHILRFMTHFLLMLKSIDKIVIEGPVSLISSTRNISLLIMLDWWQIFFLPFDEVNIAAVRVYDSFVGSDNSRAVCQTTGIC